MTIFIYGSSYSTTRSFISAFFTMFFHCLIISSTKTSVTSEKTLNSVRFNDTTKQQEAKSPKKSPQKHKQSKEERQAYEEKRLRTPDKRFGGLTEEQVRELFLPDRLADNLDVLFVSLFSFFKQATLLQPVTTA